MQASSTLGLVVLVLLALGIGWFLLRPSTSPTTPSTVTPPTATTPSPSPSPTPSPSSECPSAADLSMSQTIEYRDGQFFAQGEAQASDTFCVPKGGTVTFTGSNLWVASDPHPIHTDLSGFDARGVKSSYSFTFSQTGEWGFHNHQRATDTGTIIVVD